jgi:hypothetical protein
MLLGKYTRSILLFRYSSAFLVEYLNRYSDVMKSIAKNGAIGENCAKVKSVPPQPSSSGVKMLT